ncbi:YbaB/EbfC family nucleoid-associated protein [Natronoglycomyces albus]|uniref:YbaB/EbfC family nucleoid-associated protein n=1 Tax=Natronoglycomyces albus TaxID=2811108 RepID=A0A895XKE6_9ACTN|nr:YbaB/EbfC family nucleoid-associated protein [Natronoglycomyces albus]QSB04033.1 YbaB/EbfC family nucleoid-associated protein [Natronoglycomyces albus]
MTDNNPLSGMRNNPRPDPEEMMAKLEEMQREAEQTLAKYEQLQAEMASESTEAVSEDGSIKVVLNSEGHVTDIDIEDAAMRHGTRLGGMIRQTIDEATATYSMKMAQMAQQLVGDMDIMGMVTDSIPENVRDRARDNLGRRD